MSKHEEEDEDEQSSSSSKNTIFTKLKTYSIELLSLLQKNPNSPQTAKQSLTLSHLHNLLRESRSSSLQPFLDFVLFPLLLLFDASVDCRSRKEQRNDGTRMFVSDGVAEGVVLCLEELLNKCRLLSVDQMVVVLKKLTCGALLSAPEASEEFREGVIRCFRALLLGLDVCSDESCLCKQVLGFPALSAGNDLHSKHKTDSNYVSEPEECLLVFIQTPAASAAIGHWLSLLLKDADIEVARGHRGSAKLRIEAFWTLRVLVSKVGSADALAFFLPGVVSQFAKVLHLSKTMISGAAGSVESVDQAIRGLAEYLMIVLRDDTNQSGLDLSRNFNNDSKVSMDKPSESTLEELRHLVDTAHGQSKLETKEDSSVAVIPKLITDSGKSLGSLQVTRTKDWIDCTVIHVTRLLSAIFPHICVHPAKKVRAGLLAAIKGLISQCNYSLKGGRLMLLECLCVLVCDDFQDISSDAQQFLDFLFSSSEKRLVDFDVGEIFNRLIEKLPKLVLGSDGLLAVSHAQQLLVVIYYSGPHVAVDHILRSPITAARFLDVIALCIGQNSAYAGSLQKLCSARPSSTGYLSSIADLKAGTRFNSDNLEIVKVSHLEGAQEPKLQDKEIQYMLDNGEKEYELPRMPPWFVYVGSQKLYQSLAGVLRLVGLSSIAGLKSEGCLSVVTDIPLGYLHKLVSEVRKKEYSQESWQSWYIRTGSGQLMRQASTAACMLNEMIFGVSNQAIEIFRRMFNSNMDNEGEHLMYNNHMWKIYEETGTKRRLIDCIGNILHEYLSPEVWALPIEHKTSLEQSDDEAGEITSHFFNDTATLHQLIIEGIGIFNLCLGKDFASSGFLHSSLYLLLENLICSNFQIRRASDAVLHILAVTSGHSTVGQLVMANSDYIIDSICRQLRHLDLNSHVPNVLAAMLSYIGVAHKILPLLEEPFLMFCFEEEQPSGPLTSNNHCAVRIFQMRAVSLELEILGRRQHPNLTLPFLKAVSEIVKASKHEACLLPTQAESYNTHVKSIMSDVEKNTSTDDKSFESVYDDTAPVESDVATNFKNDKIHLEQWENVLFKLNDSKRHRHTVGSIAASCLLAATPILGSAKQACCLVALDIVEVGIATLAKVEEAYKTEKVTREAIEQVIELHSYYHLQDNLDAANDGADENRLLPAVNKIWPFLIVCVQNKNPVTVQRCLDVISKVVQIGGGDFFSRRFHNDGPHIWKLLTSSPFRKKPISKEDRTPLQLPYRSSPYSSEDSMSEVSNLKVQVAVLKMIANLSQNKRSSSSLEVVFKKISGLVVSIACSGVTGLRDASVNALVGLASMDPDLIWLLLADVYYSLKKKNMPTPPNADFPNFDLILPPPLTSNGYLYVQYGGKSYGFDVDFASVETVFKRLHSIVFTSDM